MHINSQHVYIVLPSLPLSSHCLTTLCLYCPAPAFPLEHSGYKWAVQQRQELKGMPQSYNSHSSILTKKSNLSFSYYSDLGSCHFVWHTNKCKSWKKKKNINTADESFCSHLLEIFIYLSNLTFSAKWSNSWVIQVKGEKNWTLWD